MSSTGTEVFVNGESHELPSAFTIHELLERLDLKGRKVAVALNRSVVPRSRYAQTSLTAGDHIEILEAVGGG
jgi:sulfur carrier protein